MKPPKFLNRSLLGVAYLFFLLQLTTPFVFHKGFLDVVLAPKLIWFSICTAFFVTLLFFYFLVVPYKYKLQINGLDISVLCFFLYIHINHYFTNISYISSKISISTAIVICYIILRVKLNERSIDDFISCFIPIPFITAAITSVIALCQYILPTNFGTGIGMTVAMGNSGAVGSYLAMLFPWMLIFVNRAYKKSIRYLYRIVIVLTLIALFFMQARAAWLAVIFSCLFVFTFRNIVTISKLIKRHSKYKYLFFTSLIALMLFSGYELFHLKKDSANGRIFIWKRTMEIITDHPFGVGYNKFGSIYPDYQASYLQSQPNDSSRFLAGDINHPFNEYLYFTAELGVVGLTLFLAIIFFIFLLYHHHRKNMSETLLACYGGIFSFLVLSFFTYPFKIFSVQFLFISFIAVISSQYKKKTLFSIPKRSVGYITLGACIFMFLCAGSELKRFKRESLWLKVHELRNDASWQTRSKIFNELYPSNASNWEFLSIYGIELTVNKDYEKSITVLQKATQYMKTSDLYTHLGISFEETGDYQNSRASYEMAINLVPHKFFPRYRLVYLYNKMGLKKEALNLAIEIVTTPAKINSKTVQGIKYEMKKYIKQNDDD